MHTREEGSIASSSLLQSLLQLPQTEKTRLRQCIPLQLTGQLVDTSCILPAKQCLLLDTLPSPSYTDPQASAQYKAQTLN